MREKDRRHLIISRLIRQGSVASQDDLQRQLESHGVEATQATLSRDLRELGVLKGPGGYVLPEPTTSDTASPASTTLGVRSFLRGATPAGTLVVAKTGPGQASALALEFDHSPWPEIVGTVAGDDTVFIATESSSAARALASKLLGGAGRHAKRGRA